MFELIFCHVFEIRGLLIRGVRVRVRVREKQSQNDENWVNKNQFRKLIEIA